MEASKATHSAVAGPQAEPLQRYIDPRHRPDPHPAIACRPAVSPNGSTLEPWSDRSPATTKTKLATGWPSWHADTISTSATGLHFSSEPGCSTLAGGSAGSGRP